MIPPRIPPCTSFQSVTVWRSGHCCPAPPRCAPLAPPVHPHPGTTGRHWNPAPALSPCSVKWVDMGVLLRISHTSIHKVKGPKDSMQLQMVWSLHKQDHTSAECALHLHVHTHRLHSGKSLAQALGKTGWYKCTWPHICTPFVLHLYTEDFTLASSLLQFQGQVPGLRGHPTFPIRAVQYAEWRLTPATQCLLTGGAAVCNEQRKLLHQQ